MTTHRRPTAPDLVRPARRRARRLRGRDPRRVEGRDRRPRPDRPPVPRCSTRPPRCSSTTTAGRRTTSSCAPPSVPRRGPRWPRTSSSRALHDGLDELDRRRSPRRLRSCPAGCWSPSRPLAALVVAACAASWPHGALRRAHRRRDQRRPRRAERAIVPDPGLRLPPPRRGPEGRRGLHDRRRTAKKYDKLFAGIGRTPPRPEGDRDRRGGRLRHRPVRRRPGRRSWSSSTGRPPASRARRADRLQGPGHRDHGEGRRRLARRRPGPPRLLIAGRGGRSRPSRDPATGRALSPGLVTVAARPPGHRGCATAPGPTGCPHARVGEDASRRPRTSSTLVGSAGAECLRRGRRPRCSTCCCWSSSSSSCCTRSGPRWPSASWSPSRSCSSASSPRSRRSWCCRSRRRTTSAPTRSRTSIWLMAVLTVDDRGAGRLHAARAPQGARAQRGRQQRPRRRPRAAGRGVLTA